MRPITIIHPSRGRPEQAYQTFKNWYSKADNLKNIDYVLSVDHDDIRNGNSSYLGWGVPEDINFHARIGWNKSAIEAINSVANTFDFNLLIVISDDFSTPNHWDTLLLKELEGKSDFCVKTDDGLQPTLITMPIMDRVYYERYGYVYHPDYLHMFADQELTAVAMMTGKYIKLDLSFPHLHYSTGKSPKDEVNVRNDMTWKQGQRLFDKNLENNFGIESPVMAYTDIIWK